MDENPARLNDDNSPLPALRELLRRKACDLGLLSPDQRGEEAIDAAVEAVLEREVKTPEPTDEECCRFYTTHPERFTSGELAFVRHILFAVTPGVPVDALRSKAEAILRELHEEPARFPALADQYSNCPSGQQGGNLGQLTRGECVPEFERVVFDTRSTGLLPELVRTRFGFHIVVVDVRVPGQAVPYEAVSGKIAAYLRECVQRKALEQYARVLAAEVGVAVPGLTHATSPLLQ